MIGASLQNKWRIIALLSDAGGNAELWLGENNHGLVAAIKMPRDIEDSGRHTKRLKRFENEINTMLYLQRLNIKSVMPIIDHGVAENSNPWYAMPIGSPLSLLPSFISRLALVAQLSEVTVQLHKNGVEHLDIKLGNLLMVNGLVYLSDFGHAKFTDPNLLVSGPDTNDMSSVATLKVPIETDRRWFDYDLYSLGKASWEILTGEKSKSLCELSSPDDDLQPYWPSIDAAIIRALQQLIFSAARKNPRERPDAFQYNRHIQRVLLSAKQ